MAQTVSGVHLFSKLVSPVIVSASAESSKQTVQVTPPDSIKHKHFILMHDIPLLIKPISNKLGWLLLWISLCIWEYLGSDERFRRNWNGHLRNECGEQTNPRDCLSHKGSRASFSGVLLSASEQHRPSVTRTEHRHCLDTPICKKTVASMQQSFF